MSGKTIYQLLAVTALAATLAACGGSTSGGDDDNGGGSSGGGSGSGGGGTTNPDNPSSTTRIGSFDGNGNFQEGVINATPRQLVSGATSELQVVLVDGQGTRLSSDVDVRFTSPCIADGLAEVDPATASTTSGSARTTYTARGCDGADTVSASAIIDQTTYRATTSIETESAAPGALSFQSVSNTLLGIRGAGSSLPEQSEVVFQVTDDNGNPTPNQPVNFSLSSDTGGISLGAQSNQTDTNGVARTTITSGTVATTVRVKATVTTTDGRNLTSQSSRLAITTGVPDNGSMTLGAETLNIEGLRFADTTTTLSAFLADRFNNPAPDGTSVTFTSEGGTVEGSCETEGGSCSVSLTSTNPKPADGRVTVLATATGEEDFVDTNGNGRFDCDSADTFTDLGEAFADENENGRYDSGEFFIDLNGDNSYSSGDGRYNGIFRGEGCPTIEASSINVRDSVVIVFSGSSQTINISPANIALSDTPVTVLVSVVDQNGQRPPAQTTIAATTSRGEIDGPTSYTVDSSNAPGPYVANFTLEPGTEGGTGTFRIDVTTPRGIVTRSNTQVTQEN